MAETDTSGRHDMSEQNEANEANAGRAARTKGGPAHDPLWTILHNAVTKCHCRSHPRYADYGGRGITVCPSWYDPETGRHDVERFRRWALANGYAEGRGLQLGRKDPNGNYSPQNCVFATPAALSRTRRSAVLIEINGETKCAKDWCAISGVPYESFWMRKRQGWEPVLAATVPPGVRRSALAKLAVPFSPLDNAGIAAYFSALPKP